MSERAVCRYCAAEYTICAHCPPERLARIAREDGRTADVANRRATDLARSPTERCLMNWTSMLLNWKTTLAGVGVGLTAAGHLAHALSTGDTSTIMADGSAILIGFGLLAAKDAGKAG